MVNHEPLITDADLEQVHLDIGSTKWQTDLAGLFEKEPKLAEAMSTNWHRIDELLAKFALTPIQQAVLKTQMTLLMGKPLVLLDRAHRRLWDDVLPDLSTKGE